MIQKHYKWWLLLLVMVSSFMAVLDTTIVNVGLETIMRSFGKPLIDVEWVVTGYLLSMCVMLPSAAAMGERWGVKLFFVLGLSVFTLGSLMCSISDTLSSLIFWRVIEGFGSGVLQSLGMALVIKEFQAKERGLALGLWAMASAVSVSMGPYLGGLLVSHYPWNSLFMVNVPIGIITIIAAWLIMKEQKEPATGRFDFWGLILIGLSTPLLVLGLALGSDGKWFTVEVIGTILVAITLLTIFILRSLRIASPLINLRLFRFQSFSIAMAVILLFGIGLYSGNYLLPQFLEHSLGYTALAAGSVFLPVGVIQGALAPMSGYLSRYTGNKILVVAGLMIFVSYFMISAFFTSTTPHYMIMLSLYLRGIGIGLSFTPLTTLAVSQLGPKDMASASSVANTVKQLSGSIGIALFTAMLASRVAHHALTVSAPEAYIRAIDESFLISAIISAIGLVVVLFLRTVKTK